MFHPIYSKNFSLNCKIISVNYKFIYISEEMAKKEYKVKKKRSFAFHLLRGFLKIFLRKSKIVKAADCTLQKKAIYIMNHCGARGPLIFELRFPVRSSPWGAHEMCGNYRERWNYLYHVFYIQKMHWCKARAFIVATLFAIISKWLYNSVGLIGTYRDARFLKSLKNSIAVLNADLSIVIYPEDSDEGYFEEARAFHKGFIQLSKLYRRREGQDLPVYSVYYNRKKNSFFVDEPLYINKMLEEGMTEDEISALFLEKNNSHSK